MEHERHDISHSSIWDRMGCADRQIKERKFSDNFTKVFEVMLEIHKLHATNIWPENHLIDLEGPISEEVATFMHVRSMIWLGKPVTIKGRWQLRLPSKHLRIHLPEDRDKNKPMPFRQGSLWSCLDSQKKPKMALGSAGRTQTPETSETGCPRNFHPKA